MLKKLTLSAISLFCLLNTGAQKPNIIFIYADDWGYGDLSLHGHSTITTPNLDRLANEGIDFQRFNVCNPVCSPSRAAIMTGHFPARYCIHQHFATAEMNRDRGMPDWLDPTAPMLPRELKNAGYRTAHYGKWHLTNSGVYNPPLPGVYGYDDTRVYNGPGPQVGTPIGVSTGACVDFTIDFIKNAGNDPFFVNLWIHESHTVIDPPQDAKDAYAHIEEPYRSYYACISYADRELGRLFKYLRDENLDDKTLIIFSSDNGPESPSSNPDAITWYSRGETAGLRGQKRSLHEGGVGVPFIVHWPGKVPAGQVDTVTNIAGVDMFPTLLNIAGVPLPEGYEADGEDVSAAFFGQETRRTAPLFWEWRGTDAGENWPRLAVRKGDWKLLTNYDGSVRTLYNIYENRAEQNDSSSFYPELSNELFQLLLQWKESMPTEPDPDCIQKLPETSFVNYNDFYYKQYIPWSSPRALLFSDRQDNPGPSAINPDPKVGKVVREAGRFASLLFQAGEYIDLTENSIFKIKVYYESSSPPPSNCNVRLILRNNGITTTQYSITQPVTESNAWVEYSFDCAGADGRDDYNQVNLFFSSPDDLGNTEGQVFYIDDLMGPPTDLGVYPGDVYTSIHGDSIVMDLSKTLSELELVSETAFKVFWADTGEDIPVSRVTNDLHRVFLHFDTAFTPDLSRELVLSYLSGNIKDIDGQVLPSFNDYLVRQVPPPPSVLIFVLTDSYSGFFVPNTEIKVDTITRLTNSAGEAIFLLPQKQYDYSITKDGYFSVESELTIISDTLVPISLTKSAANLKFKITDGTQAIYNAKVEINEQTKYTNSLGLAGFNDLPVNSIYTYSVSKDYFKPLNDEIIILHDTTLELSLEPATGINHSGQEEVKIIQYGSQVALIIESEEPVKKLEVFNILGERLRIYKQIPGTNQIDVNGLEKGVFILRVGFEGREFVKRVVVY